jgi:hypothetical protein
MGLWASIKALGKAPKVIDTGLDLITTGAKGIDAMFYTKEEQAGDRAKASASIIAHAVEMNKMANEEQSVRSVTRRWLALGLVFNSVMVFDYCIYLLQVGKEDLVGKIIKITAAWGMDNALLAVVIFYFGYYGASKIVASMGKKNSH